MATRGRKPSSPAVPVGPDVVTQTPPDMVAEEAARNRELQALAATWQRDLGEYDRDRYVDETRFFLGQSQAAFFEAGRRLIVMREREGYGQFAAVCDQVGLSRRAAYRLIQATVKLGDRPKLCQQLA